MGYYVIENDLREEFVGKIYPQVECENMFQAQLITSWRHFNPHPRLNFKLNRRAILTDFLNQLSISSSGFLINSKVKQILEDFQLMDHQLFETNLKLKNGSIRYYWLHLSQVDLVKDLDYIKTEFYKTDFTFREGRIELNSYEHYRQIKGQDKEARFGIDLEKIALSEEFDKGLDMFTFLPFDRNVYVSESLTKALIENRISGITLTPTEKFEIN